MKNLSNYHLPTEGQTILWDEHNRPYYQVKGKKNEFFQIYLSKKGEYNYSINRH